jgi:hypothetical protein
MDLNEFTIKPGQRFSFMTFDARWFIGDILTYLGLDRKSDHRAEFQLVSSCGPHLQRGRCITSVIPVSSGTGQDAA